MKIIDGNAMLERLKQLYFDKKIDLGYYNAVKEAVQMQDEAKTCELVAEMRNREGVKQYDVPPYTMSGISVEGPVVVLVVED